MRQSTKNTLGRYWEQSKKYKYALFIMIISMLASTAIDLLVPYLFKIFFDILSNGDTSQEIASHLLTILFYISGAWSVYWVFQRSIHFSTTYFQSNTMRDLYNLCFEYLHQHSYRFFTNNFSGSLVKKVGRFVRSFETFADKFYFDLFPLIIKIFVIFIVLFSIKPVMGLIVLIWSIIFVVSTIYFTKFKWKYDLMRAEMDTKLTGVLSDTITNNLNIKSFSTLKYELNNFYKITSKWAKKLAFEWNISQIADAFQDFMMIVLEFSILYFAIQAWLDGKIGIGDFVLIQVYLFEIFDNIWRFGRTIREIYRALADSEEMTVILDKKHEIRDLKNAKDISIKRGKIEFKKVDFSYSKNEKLISNLSFKIKEGEKVALVGPSGGGKSTIIKLILRLFNLKSGKILIDNQDISKVTQSSLRSQISFVSQDPILFHRSLIDNIRYGRLDASDEEVIYASKLAKCHDFIMKLPKKYQTMVGERGIKLSGGERQRVAIARAILSNAQIMILDEATSSLDSESESQIQEALANLIKNKTTIVIAHRLSTITQMDRIILFQDGKIAEDGRHADLINHNAGLYKKLWELQVKGYLE